MANICDNEITIFPKDAESTFTKKQRQKIKQYFNSERLYEVLSCIYIDFMDDDYIEAQGDSKWSVCSLSWSKFAQEMKVNVRIVGREDGIGFIQVVKCYADGTYTEEEIDLVL